MRNFQEYLFYRTPPAAASHMTEYSIKTKEASLLTELGWHEKNQIESSVICFQVIPARKLKYVLLLALFRVRGIAQICFRTPLFKSL